MTFTHGDKVNWTSQAQGSATTKHGTICAVIPAGAYVRDHLSGLQKLQAKDWSIMARREESYVVHVPSKSGKGQGKLYWPRTSALRFKL